LIRGTFYVMRASWLLRSRLYAKSRREFVRMRKLIHPRGAAARCHKQPEHSSKAPRACVKSSPGTMTEARSQCLSCYITKHMMWHERTIDHASHKSGGSMEAPGGIAFPLPEALLLGVLSLLRGEAMLTALYPPFPATPPP
jgi:hypothetical protein